MLITVFDTWHQGHQEPGLNQDPSDSECSALTHFSMSLVHKYANLKDYYNRDLKEQVTTFQVIY